MTDVRILTDPLGGSALSQLLQRGEAPHSWLPPAPAGPEAWKQLATMRRSERDWGARWDALAPALDASGAAADRLARVRREGGVVVTTGQQPGLFGGPIYTWSKAVGALALADAIEEAIGVPTAAVFWAATDDTDFAEAASTVIARVGGADRIQLDVPPAAGTPMSLAALGEVDALIAALAAACGSAADHRPLAAVQQAYRAGATIGGAYLALLRALLEPLGIPVLDAAHDAVAGAGRELAMQALDSAGAVERSLAARTAEMRSAGLEPQVSDVPGLTLVFGRVDGIKRRLAAGEAGAEFEALTPNVLLRPLVERELLPTIAYVAGPGELAYFAQVSAVADALGRAAPLAVPRWSCTLLEPHVDAVLHRLGLQREDIDAPHAATRQLARRAMSDRTKGAIERMRHEIDCLPQSLGEEPTTLGLDAAVQGAIRLLRHRVDRLERRLLSRIARREVELMQDLATVRGALHPFDERQERALNIIPLLARHGVELLDEMRRAAQPHAQRIVGTSASQSAGISGTHTHTRTP